MKSLSGISSLFSGLGICDGLMSGILITVSFGVRHARRFDKRDPDWRAAAARLELLRDRVERELEASRRPQVSSSIGDLTLQVPIPYLSQKSCYIMLSQM